MPDYQKGKIYKIVNIVNLDTYVGSTTRKTVNRRFSFHIQDAKNEKNTSKIYCAIREYGKDKFQVHLLENYPCNSLTELLMREQFYIKQLNPAYNMQAAYANDADKKAKKAITNKRYVMNNPDKVQQATKRFYAKNKEKIKLEMKKKTYCNICKCDIRNDVIRRHEKTTKHLDNVNGIIRVKVDPCKVDIHCDTCNVDVRVHKYPRHKKTERHLKNELKQKLDENNI